MEAVDKGSMSSRSVDLAQFACAFAQVDQLTELMDGLGEAVYLVDRTRTILFWNKACERLTGYGAADVVGRRCYEDILRHIDEQGRRLCLELCPLAGAIADGNPRRCHVWLHHRNGHRLPVRVFVQPLRDADGAIIGAVETFSDASALTAVRKRLREMERLAMIDQLTDIPNRRYLEMALSSRLAEVRRYGRPTSVAVLDLDHFKAVNDTFGHQKGDAILRMLATVLVANARADDVVARLGGDEFVVLLQNAHPSGAAAACRRLLMLVANSEVDDGARGVSVTASIGVTVAIAEDDAQSVLDRADRLLYRAKRARNTVVADLVCEPAPCCQPSGRKCNRTSSLLEVTNDPEARRSGVGREGR